MHITLHQIILIAAFVCSLLATLGIPAPPRFQFFPAALMLLIVATFFV